MLPSGSEKAQPSKSHVSAAHVNVKLAVGARFPPPPPAVAAPAIAASAAGDREEDAERVECT